MLSIILVQARREKISERMKILQDLVPSCNKVTFNCIWTFLTLLEPYTILFHMRVVNMNMGFFASG